MNDGGPAALDAGQLAARSWELLDFLSQPTVWRAALALGGRVQILPERLAPAAARAWRQGHAWPAWRGGAFRRWLAERRGQER